jgi:AraC-like DNA-binding protein
MKYMGEPDLSLSQIATMLHFSDGSAFYRAFRRWTGGVPGEYRRRYRTCDGRGMSISQ